MKKILAIGNSFSQDATTFLETLADDLFVRNVYKPGCSLETHAHNITEDVRAYEYQKDGKRLSDEPVALSPLLMAEKWDFVTVQQASGYSGLYESYVPHLNVVLNAVRTACPTAKIVFHETWTYTSYSTHKHFPFYQNDRETMYQAICKTTERISKEYGLPVIRTGEVLDKLRESPLCEEDEFSRDGYHLSLTDGRFVAGVVWARYFSEKETLTVPPEMEKERAKELINAVDAILQNL